MNECCGRAMVESIVPRTFEFCAGDDLVLITHEVPVMVCNICGCVVHDEDMTAKQPLKRSEMAAERLSQICGDTMSGIVNSLLSKIVSLEKALAESERMNEILIERLDEEADELSAKIDEMQYVRRQDVVRNTQLQEAMDAVEGGEDA